MAKGNFLLGYARGSVGDVTFSRVKGNQVAKARNRNPANPNTIPQAMQRSLFADAVRFYTRGVQNAFKFAFERKLENESDYNAFMRLNVNRGVRIGKTPESMYPAIGEWLVADGSITPPLKYDAVQSTAAGDFVAGAYEVADATPSEFAEGDDPQSSSITLGFTTASAPTTVGALSLALKVQFPQLRDGDFVTILLISQAFTGTIGDTFPSPGGYAEGLMEDPAWSFAQFTIDEGSTANVSTIYHSPGTELNISAVKDGESSISLYRESQFIPEVGDTYGTIAAGAVIFSRQTSSGLLVSTAPLSSGYQYQQAVAESRTKAWEDFVMVDWGAADPAILQGYYVQA